MSFMTTMLPTRTFSRFAATAALATAALIASTSFTPQQLSAQERLAPAAGQAATLTDGTQPVVVVTVASVNKLSQDVNYVTGLIGQPQFGGLFSMMAQGQLAGMDMDRPIGIVVPMVGGTPQPIAILPTSDIKSMLKRFEPQTGPVDELDDGTLVVTVNQNTVYIKQDGDNALAAQARDALKLIPSDLTGMFQGMGNQYDLAARVKVQQIPPEVRNILIDQMRQGFEQAMSRQPNADQTREIAESSIQQIETLVQEADEINFGINIDDSAKHIAIDTSFTALSGTNLAAVYGGQQSIPSRFASVIREDAAAYIHSASSIGPEAIDQAKDGIQASMSMVKGAMTSQGNLPADAVREIEQYMQRFTEILIESISEGKADTGMLLLTEPGQFQFVFGSFVGDGSKVADLAKDLASKVPDDPKAPKFKFDIGEFEGVTMHLIEADVPEREDEARKAFGEKIQIHIGTAPKAIYIAVGKKSDELLKEFIRSGANDDTADRPLGQMKVRLMPILEFAQSIEQSEPVSIMINALQGGPGLDEINVVSHSIPNGADSKVTMGEGLLKAIGAAVVAAQQRNAPAF